jgi:isopentenyl-diphosphate Delta-isomerase
MDKPNLQRPSVPQRQDEIFDVVDAGDQVIGRATRREVHARHLWHRAVHVLVFNPAGEVFLQKRSLAKDSWPGCWDSSCSGHLDSGEDYLPAAVRELGEEIGIVADPEALVFRLKLAPAAETGWEFVSIFTLQSAAAVQVNPAEIDGGQWLSPAELNAKLREHPAEFTSTLRLHWPVVGKALGGRL